LSIKAIFCPSYLLSKTVLQAIIAVALFCVTCDKAMSSQMPRYLGKEKKFRMFIYNPYDVYHFIGNYNYQAFLEFQGNVVAQANNLDNVMVKTNSRSPEQIIEVAIGNSDAWLWKIAENKNRLYLKPVSDNANTNMTIKTNLGRIYNFELLARTPDGPNDNNLIFAYKFVYPDDTNKNILQFPKTPASDIPDMKNLSIYNFNYDFTGEPRIAPSKVFDNGEFTYMKFPSKGSELPAVFSVDSEGFESLVNFRIAGDYVIVERVSAQFTLRNGSDIVCIYNNTLFRSGIPSIKQ
jgi:type IV secretion system protein VirB9